MSGQGLGSEGSTRFVVGETPIELGPVQQTAVAQLNPFVYPGMAVPEIGGDDEARLIESVKVEGVRDPLWILPDGRVLDGRGRLGAAEQAGLERVPTRTLLTPLTDDEVKRLAVHLALDRRHLLPPQVLSVLLQFAEIEREARESVARPRGRPRRGEISRAPSTSHDSRVQEQVGRAAGLAGRTVRTFERVRRRASPALVARVGKDVSIHAAHRAVTVVPDCSGHDEILHALTQAIPRRLWELSAGFHDWPHDDRQTFLDLLRGFADDLRAIPAGSTGHGDA